MKSEKNISADRDSAETRFLQIFRRFDYGPPRYRNEAYVSRARSYRKERGNNAKTSKRVHVANSKLP